MLNTVVSEEPKEILMNCRDPGSEKTRTKPLNFNFHDWEEVRIPRTHSPEEHSGQESTSIVGRAIYS